MKYDYLVFIGRFQPFHNGHKRVVDKALKLSEHTIMLIGSANVARSSRNSWTFEERCEMVRRVYPEEVASGKLILQPMDDFTYNDAAWVTRAQSIVNTVISLIPGNSKGVTLHGHNDVKVGLIGCNKDHTSFYLKLFPTWGTEEVPFFNPINATDIRETYFENGWPMSLQLPSQVSSYLVDWKKHEDYQMLRQEMLFVQRYKEQWQNSPYPPVFVTVDAVVVQSGHVLVVRRGAHPGKGKIALPGGFLDKDERIEQAVLRELREETGLKIPEPVLRGSCVDSMVFDDPHRSSRGRTITHAYLIQLDDDINLPKVRGGDDAAKAFWMPLAEVKENAREFFEDHWFIIQKMVGNI